MEALAGLSVKEVMPAIENLSGHALAQMESLLGETFVDLSTTRDGVARLVGIVDDANRDLQEALGDLNIGA